MTKGKVLERETPDTKLDPKKDKAMEKNIDRALDDSFPASDSPSWTGTSIGQ